jgi:hypothetical protein
MNGADDLPASVRDALARSDDLDERARLLDQLCAQAEAVGDSALLAAWLARREAASESVPHHFIRRGEYDWDDPAKLAASLVAQIVALFPAHPEPEADARMHPAARLQSRIRRRA